ncbi:hypothetical protein SYNPS1DRAFT_12327 [Syncephalis pseudoplumigaleata]|uniref:Transmembrane protein n=1 Tax=Syncephalis pseudoplumigaleata TaxID=1712513 RepID=A0A4V1J285_9FUNG|nr:hypothetical protein SYNPS1DRAFT_12327 [Syncephalis pseudoplumigaleata]|eukprot:RKP27679.1 hypothetical protein SYNPS1DRAFT_12327 [Syncephalis pseudoplumigaleata]
MVGTPVGILFDPDYAPVLCRCFFATSLLTGLLIIFCALLSVRVDGKSNWSWGVVFIPLWLLDAVLLFWLVPLAFRPSLTASGHSSGDKRSSKQARRARAARQRGIFVCIYLLLCFIFQLLIVLREDERITWSAAAIFFPYWILEAVNGLSNILSSIADIRTIPEVDPTTNAPMEGSKRRLLEAMVTVNAFWWWCIRVALAILVVLKIDGALSANWATVFTPAYLAGIRYILLFAVAGLRLRMKLEDPSGRGMAVVLVPVFIVLSMLFCCTCCCAPCLFCAQNLPADGLADEAINRLPVPVHRRIMYHPPGHTATV